MLRIVKGFAPWILIDCLMKSFYIRWSAGRSPRVHEVNPGRDPSTLIDCLRKSFYIRWSAGRSPRVHEVNPGQDPSVPLMISRGFVDWNSSGQELKFITSTRATRRHQKGEISPKIQKRRFGGNQSFRVRRCFEVS